MPPGIDRLWPLMRIIAFVLFVIAAGKVGLQEHFYRTATREAIVAAYRDRAIAACQRNPEGARLIAAPELWANPADIRLVIGKSGIDVWLWQIDHANWAARWRDPYLHLVATGAPNTIVCEYDVVRGNTLVRAS